MFFGVFSFFPSTFLGIFSSSAAELKKKGGKILKFSPEVIIMTQKERKPWKSSEVLTKKGKLENQEKFE